MGQHKSLVNTSFKTFLKVPKSSRKIFFKNLKVTRLLGMISGMPKLPEFQSLRGAISKTG